MINYFLAVPIAVVVLVALAGAGLVVRDELVDEKSGAALQVLSREYHAPLSASEYDSEWTLSNSEARLKAIREKVATVADWRTRQAYLNWIDYGLMRVEQARAQKQERMEENKIAETLERPGP